MIRKMSANALDAKEVTKAAINSIGLGYDLASDLRLESCKRFSVDPRLIAIDDDEVRAIELPGGISIQNVPKSIKCYKGERVRLCSDVLSFQQMSEQFNQELSVFGKIPTGKFNAAFEFTGVWQKDAANTKTLAFDGVFITLYNIALEKPQVVLLDFVKQAVPTAWDPAALARFIEKYGTHIIVGVKIGGTDIIYAKQKYSSPLQPADVEEKLKDEADKLFIDAAGRNNANNGKFNEKEKVQDIEFLCKRKGGNGKKYQTHNEWCQTVQSQPDVISMLFIPITSLLSGINGSGFLTHAINIYLRYKPPIEELHQFLAFQLPREWAPKYCKLNLGSERNQQNTASLQFSFMGPKLYVDTIPVEVGKRPVTGLRLYLEGRRSNRLAIHLQHLSSLPESFILEDDLNTNAPNTISEAKYYEKVQWSNSYVCTAPVVSGEDNSIVTGAHLEVGKTDGKKVLFLRLHFSKVVGAILVKSAEWDGSPPGLIQKSGTFSNLSTLFSKKPSVKQSNNVSINSSIYPLPILTPKLQRFVDTTEITRGPQDLPGYWLVCGAGLIVERGKISLRVKYSLLTMYLPDDDTAT